jgi:hypothetical protein
LPFLAAAGQIYPDLVTGVLLLGLGYVLYAESEGPVGPVLLAAAAVVLAALPWLHIKNVLPAAILGFAILALEARRCRSWPRARRLTSLILPPACSLGLLAAYNLAAFGSPMGPGTGTNPAFATPRQAAMILLGLHLDQAQGLFIQQPLFILALPGVALLVHHRPICGWTLIAAYLAVLIPNAFHPCWYGCFSMSGRFMWGAAALWFFPLVFLYAELGAVARRAVLALAGGAVGWQIYFMSQWRKGPISMYLSFVTSLSGRNSLFEDGWRRVLPSFYDFDRYVVRTVNIVSVGLVVALLVIGLAYVLSLRRASRHAVTNRPGTSSRLLRAERTPDAALALSLACIIAVGIAAVIAYARPGAGIDLVQRFSIAEKRPLGAGSETFAVREETIARDTRRAIYAHPPSRLTWVITVPDDAVLDTAIGVDKQAWDRPGDGVVFRIGVSAAVQGYEELLTLQVDPHSTPADRRWIPVRIDLARYAGKTIRLILNTNTSMPGKGNDGRNDLAYWGAPIVRPY